MSNSLKASGKESGDKKRERKRTPPTSVEERAMLKFLPDRKAKRMHITPAHPVYKAYKALRDQRATLTEGEDLDSLSSGMSAAAGLLVDPNVTYLFRLVYTGVITQVNAAQTRGAVSWDPSNNAGTGGLNITEYVSYLINLFNQVRIRRARITYVPVSNEFGDKTAFAVNSDLGLAGVVPGSLSTVSENPNSRFISMYQATNAHIMDVRVPDDYLFATCAAGVSPSLTPGAGTYGQFSFAQVNGAGSNNTAFSILFEGWYEFRSRT